MSSYCFLSTLPLPGESGWQQPSQTFRMPSEPSAASDVPQACQHHWGSSCAPLCYLASLLAVCFGILLPTLRLLTQPCTEPPMILIVEHKIGTAHWFRRCQQSLWKRKPKKLRPGVKMRKISFGRSEAPIPPPRGNASPLHSSKQECNPKPAKQASKQTNPKPTTLNQAPSHPEAPPISSQGQAQSHPKATLDQDSGVKTTVGIKQSSARGTANTLLIFQCARHTRGQLCACLLLLLSFVPQILLPICCATEHRSSYFPWPAPTWFARGHSQRPT